MSLFAHIIDGPMTPATEAAAIASAPSEFAAVGSGGDVGAVVRFEGIVRRVESGRDLLALEYQTYDPMALRELERLAGIVRETHGLKSLMVLHSRGRVGVSECSFVLVVRAEHRAGALRAVGEFIDRMKQDVPIWKRPIWA